MTIAKLIPRKWILMSLLISVQCLAQVEVVSYDYWFNNDYLNKVSTNITTPSETFELNENIVTNGLSYGINTFNIRFKDNSNLWSGVLSEFFYKAPQSTSTNREIVVYEYWYNNNVNSRISQTVTGTEQLNLVTALDASALQNGINTFNIRFKDDSNLWSGVLTEFFYKAPQSTSENRKIIEYEYWYNNESASRISENVPATEQLNLVTALDASALQNGINTFNIRFKDNSNLWSGVLTEFFYKAPHSTSVNREIVEYEYWYNNESASRVSENVPATEQLNLVTAIDASALQNGINTFNIRFKDNSNLWSGIKTEFFLKLKEEDLTDNNIVAYRYWVDDAFDEMVEVILPSPITPLETIAPINVSNIWQGTHTINFQFKDSKGYWSGVLKETFTKEVLPVALFSVDIDEVCLGNAFTFTNESIDFDTQLWDFGDGNTSTEVNVTHIYSTFGEFDVSLTVTDTESAKDSVITKKVKVFETPSNEVTSNTTFPACFGAEVTLSATANGTYLWSNGETTKSITTTTPGDYSVTITGDASCSQTSDVISVTYKNEIDKSITFDGLTITASLSGATYQWVDCNNGNAVISGETSQFYSPTVVGSYAVEITMDGCTVTSDCTDIMDSDGDGIVDGLDQCPNTPNGAIIDVHGCSAFLLPSSNYTITITSETCRNMNNGIIEITAVQSNNYTVTISGNGINNSIQFTTSTEINNLKSGTYNVCFTVDGKANYEQCFTIVIVEPDDLAVLSKVSAKNKTVDLSLFGSLDFYYIKLNGKSYITSESEISLQLIEGVNQLEVKTASACQGVYVETIEMFSELTLYPNPTKGNVTLYAGEALSGGITVEIYNINKQLLQLNNYQSINNSVRMEVEHLPNSVYFIVVKTTTKQFNFKLIKL